MNRKGPYVEITFLQATIGRSTYANVMKHRGLLQQNLESVDNRYLCKLKWAKETTDDEKGPAVTSLVATMTGHGYHVITEPSSPKYDPANFGISAVDPTATVANNWKEAVNALGGVAVDPNTIDANSVDQ
jgi:hypothetical protein